MGITKLLEWEWSSYIKTTELDVQTNSVPTGFIFRPLKSKYRRSMPWEIIWKRKVWFIHLAWCNILQNQKSLQFGSFKKGVLDLRLCCKALSLPMGKITLELCWKMERKWHLEKYWNVSTHSRPVFAFPHSTLSPV